MRVRWPVGEIHWSIGTSIWVILIINSVSNLHRGVVVQAAEGLFVVQSYHEELAVGRAELRSSGGSCF